MSRSNKYGVSSAVGLSGYLLKGPPFAHPNLHYVESSATPGIYHDGRKVQSAARGMGTIVDVLGGVMGVAYR